MMVKTAPFEWNSFIVFLKKKRKQYTVIMVKTPAFGLYGFTGTIHAKC